MLNLNVRLNKKIEDWLKENAKKSGLDPNDPEDLEFLIVIYLSRVLYSEYLEEKLEVHKDVY